MINSQSAAIGSIGLMNFLQSQALKVPQSFGKTVIYNRNGG